MENWVYLSIGGTAGVISGLFGVGGGLIIVPALLFICGFARRDAVGTSLGSLLLPVGLLGVIEYHRFGAVNIRAAMLIGIGIFLGTWVGAKVVQPLSSLFLQRLYAIFLMAVSIRLLIAR